MGRMAVQCAGGFIRQNQLGAVDDSSGTSAPLLLAAGHLIRVFIQDVRDVQFFSHIPHLSVDLVCGNLVDSQRQSDVFGDGQSVQQVKVLKHKAQIFPTKPGNLFFIYLCYIGSVQIDMSCTDRINGGNAI